MNLARRASLGLALPVCVQSQTAASIDCELTNLYIMATIGIAELLIFHPVDTIAKRLMSNKAKVSIILLLGWTSMT